MMARAAISTSKRRGRTSPRLCPLIAAILLAAVAAACNSGTRHSDGIPDSRPDAGLDAGNDGWGSAPGFHLAWAAQAGGATPFGDLGDIAWELDLAPDGALYTTGRVYSTAAVFGAGTENEISFDPLDLGMLFVARYSADGAPEWISPIRAGRYEGWDVQALDDGSVVAVGRIKSHPDDPAVFGQGQPGETALDASCDACPYLARYLADGALDWVVTGDGFEGADAQGEARRIAAAADGSYCVSGWFRNDLVLGAGTPAETVLSTSPDNARDAFAARFDPGGGLLWARRIGGGIEWEVATGVAALPDGSCAFTGFYSWWVEIQGGQADPVVLETDGKWSHFVARYDAAGDLVWARDMGIQGDSGNAQWARAAAAALGSDLLVGGAFNGSMLAGSEAAPETVSAVGGEHPRWIYLARLSGDGERVWTALAAGESATSWWEWDCINSISVLADGTILVGGHFSGTKVFGQGEPGETELVSLASADGFLALYDDQGRLHWALRAVSSASIADYDYGALVTGVGADESGSIFAVGGFPGTATFGTGPDDSIDLTEPTEFCSNDLFLMRLDPDDPPD